MARRPTIGGPGTIKSRGALRGSRSVQSSVRRRRRIDDSDELEDPPPSRPRTDVTRDDDDDGPPRPLHLRNATTDPVVRPYRLPAAVRADGETDYYVLQVELPELTDAERLAAQTGYRLDGDDARELTEDEDAALHARIRDGLRALDAALREDDEEVFARLMPVPVDGWIVRSSKSRSTLAAIPGVRFVDTFHPAFKLTSTLYERVVEPARRREESATLTLRLTPFPWEDVDAVVDAIVELGGAAEVVQIADHQHGKRRVVAVVGAVIPARALPEVARLPQLHFVEEDVVPAMLLDVATERTGVRPFGGGVRAGGDANYLGLSGAGQILGIYDTGVDNGGENPIPLAGAPPVVPAPAALVADLNVRVFGDTLAWHDPNIPVSWADRFYDGTANNVFPHGTVVTGIALGDGAASGGLLRGVAYAATAVVRPFSADFDAAWPAQPMVFDIAAALTHAHARHARVHNDSWGVASDPAGDLMNLVFSVDQYLAPDRAIDGFTRAHPKMLVVTSAGNDGNAGARTISSPGTGKNVLTVGNAGNGAPAVGNLAVMGEAGNQVAASSSRGPAPSGRLKPDVVAPGEEVAAITPQGYTTPAIAYGGYAGYHYGAGTSFAAPHVSGAALLVRQFLGNATYFAGNAAIGVRADPSGILVKALLVNGATPLGGAVAPNDDEGWGRIDLPRSLGPAGMLLVYDSSDPNDPLNQGEPYYLTSFLHRERTFDLQVPANTVELTATLAWYDRPDGGGVGALVDDLDLILRRTSNGHIYRGGPAAFANGESQALQGAQKANPLRRDHVNSVEKIRIAHPAAGAYTLRVKASTIPGWNISVPFAVVVRAL